MQSTGQASTQAVSLVPMQGSAMMYAIGHLLLAYARTGSWFKGGRRCKCDVLSLFRSGMAQLYVRFERRDQISDSDQQRCSRDCMDPRVEQASGRAREASTRTRNRLQ